MNCYVRHVLHDKSAISLWLKEAGRNLQQDALAHAEQPAPLPACSSGTAHTQQSRELRQPGTCFPLDYVPLQHASEVKMHRLLANKNMDKMSFKCITCFTS